MRTEEVGRVLRGIIAVIWVWEERSLDHSWKSGGETQINVENSIAKPSSKILAQNLFRFYSFGFMSTY